MSEMKFSVDGSEFSLSTTTVDGKEIESYEGQIVHTCILNTKAGTNCPMGGDTGHGGRTFFELEDEGSTDLRVKVDGEEFTSPSKVRIVLGGDSEELVFKKALKSALKALRKTENTSKRSGN